jgi:hypothetical protein
MHITLEWDRLQVDLQYTLFSHEWYGYYNLSLSFWPWAIPLQ